ncbi:MAG TPA: hypothetical protein VEQ10_11950 [Vicinamibacteria bacterium]|nr:hypothetical protein [Vicinamibacteria bacterium]
MTRIARPNIALAIDLGDTKASFALVDDEGALLGRSKRPSREAGRAVPS